MQGVGGFIAAQAQSGASSNTETWMNRPFRTVAVSEWTVELSEVGSGRRTRGVVVASAA